jgi:hypothetical protein
MTATFLVLSASLLLCVGVYAACPTDLTACAQFVPTPLWPSVAVGNCSVCSGLGLCVNDVCQCAQPTTGPFSGANMALDIGSKVYVGGVAMILGDSCNQVRPPGPSRQFHPLCSTE